MKTFEIVNRKGEAFKVCVDDADYESVVGSGPWFVVKAPEGGRFYVRRVRKASRWGLLHQFLLGFKGIDHIDGNGLNNTRSNLRPATAKQNAQNKRTPSTNTSGCRGVSWNKNANKWAAHIKIMGAPRHLGYFTDKNQACVAARMARSKHFEYDNPARNECEHRGQG